MNFTPREVIMRRVKQETKNQNEIIENITEVLGPEFRDFKVNSSVNNSSVLDYMN